MSIIDKIHDLIEELEEELDELKKLPASTQTEIRMKEVEDSLYFYKYGRRPPACSQ